MPQDEPTQNPAKEWLTRAKENLDLARHSEIAGVSLPLLAFHAQQAAEIAIKAVCHHHGLDFEWTHNIGSLIKGLEDEGIVPPDETNEAAKLTQYAVRTRYPGPSKPMTKEEYDEAVRLAQAVVDWASEIVGKADA